MIDVLGRPLKEAEEILTSANMEYSFEYSRPTSSFFSLDEGNYYVIRQRMLGDGRLMLTLAMKLRKEVS